MQLQIIQQLIYEIRGQKVMLDFDLAKLYSTETRTLKQAVKRNIERFPPPRFVSSRTVRYNLRFDKSSIKVMRYK